MPPDAKPPRMAHFDAHHGHGLHGFLMAELELGELVVMALDDERCGFGPWFDMLENHWRCAQQLYSLTGMAWRSG